jgi:hypothetical protein
MPICKQTLSGLPRFAVETPFLETLFPETPFLETMYLKRFIIQ